MSATSFLQHVGGSLVHTMWIGGAIGLLAFLANTVLRKAGARVRYALNLFALVGLAATLPTVLYVLPQPVTDVVETPAVAESEVVLGKTPAGILQAAGTEPSFDAGDVGGEFSETWQVRELPVASALPLTEGETDAARVPDEFTVVEPTGVISSLSPTFRLVAGCLYLLGVVAFLLRLLISVLASHKVRCCCENVESALLEQFARLARDVGLRTVPLLRYCHRVSVPMVIGTLKPIVVLPASIASGLSEEELQAILLHELAHVRRFDPVVLVFQRLIEVALFFHPVTWYLSRTVCREREHCCDDMVLKQGINQVPYATALHKIATTSVARSTLVTPAATGNRPSELKRRIWRIMGEPQPAANSWGPLVLSLLGMCVVGLLSGLSNATESRKNAASPASLTTPAEVNTKPATEPLPAAEDQTAEDGVPAPVVPASPTTVVSTPPGESEATAVEPTKVETDYSQEQASGLDRLIDIELDNASLGEFVTLFSTKVPDVKLTFSDALRLQFVKDSPRVSASVSRVTARSALAVVLAKFGLEPIEGSVDVRLRLVAPLESKQIVGGPDRVRGTVVGPNGEPVTNAEVVISLQRPHAMFSHRIVSPYTAPVVAIGKTNGRGQFEFPLPTFRAPNRCLVWVFSDTHGLTVRPLHKHDNNGSRTLLFADFSTQIAFDSQVHRPYRISEKLFSDDDKAKQSYQNSEVRPLILNLLPLADRKTLLAKAERSFFFRYNRKHRIGDLTRQELIDGLWGGTSGLREPYEIATIPQLLSDRVAATVDGDQRVAFPIALPAILAQVKTPDGVVQTCRVSSGIEVVRRATVTGRIRGYEMLPENTLRLANNQATINPDGSFEYVQPRGSIRPQFEMADGVPFFVRTTGLVLSRPHQTNHVEYEVVKAATIRGRLVDPDNNPVAGAQLSISVSSDNGNNEKFQGPRDWRVQRTDSEGHFTAIVPPARLQSLRVGSLPLGPKYLNFFGHDVAGTIQYYNERRDLSPGEIYEHPTMKLVQGHVVTGRVVDASNQPVPNAIVRGTRHKNSWWPETRTNDKGDFTLSVADIWLRRERMDIPVSVGGSLKTELFITTDNAWSIPATIESRDPWLARIPVIPANDHLKQSSRQVLGSGVTARRFVNDPLDKVLRILASPHSLVVDEKALKDRGYNLANFRVTWSMGQTTVQQVLDQLLPRYGLKWVEAKNQTRMHWLVADGQARPPETVIKIVPR